MNNKALNNTMSLPFLFRITCPTPRHLDGEETPKLGSESLYGARLQRYGPENPATRGQRQTCGKEKGKDLRGKSLVTLEQLGFPAVKKEEANVWKRKGKDLRGKSLVTLEQLGFPWVKKEEPGHPEAGCLAQEREQRGDSKTGLKSAVRRPAVKLRPKTNSDR
jgi:hypothetical protein